MNIRTITDMRSLFLKRITVLAPEVLQDLGNDPMRLYLSLQNYLETEHPRCRTSRERLWRHHLDKLLGDPLVADVDGFFPQLDALRVSLEEWARRWNLRELPGPDAVRSTGKEYFRCFKVLPGGGYLQINGQTRKWCLARAFLTLSDWATGRTITKEWSLFLYMYFAMPLVKPPADYPHWCPSGESRAQYCERIRNLLRNDFKDACRLSEGRASIRENYIESIIKKVVHPYCHEMGSRYSNRGWVRHEPPFGPQKPDLHIKWAIKFQIQG